MHSAEFRRCMVDLDVPTARRLWAHVFPHLPAPNTHHEMLAVLHHARTQANSIAERLRFYSHRWLLDHGLPTALPDALKPKAERTYPRIVEAVGIAVQATSLARAPLARAIQSAMSDAVAEAYSDGRTESGFVKARMAEARTKIIRAS